MDKTEATKLLEATKRLSEMCVCERCGKQDPVYASNGTRLVRSVYVCLCGTCKSDWERVMLDSRALRRLKRNRIDQDVAIALIERGKAASIEDQRKVLLDLLDVESECLQLLSLRARQWMAEKNDRVQEEPENVMNATMQTEIDEAMKLLND